MEFPRRLPMNFYVAAVFVAVGAVWGSAWIPVSVLSQTLPVLTAGALRFGLAALVLAVAAAMARSRGSAERRRGAAKLTGPSVLLGLVMLGLPYALTSWATDHVSPGLVPLCFGFMPFAALLMEGEVPGAGVIPAMVLGIGGVAMVVAPGLGFSWLQIGGIAALLGATGLGAVSLVYVRRLYTQGRLVNRDLLSFSAIQCSVAAVFLAIVATATGQMAGLGRDLHWDSSAAVGLAILAIVVSGVTLPLLYWLLGRITSWQAATLQWTATLIAVAEAVIKLGIRPGLEGWIGAILIPACTFQLFRVSGGEGMETVTPQITKHTFRASIASDSERKSR
jgi:probable blue pigment (indigoidine) exporter